MNKCVTQLVSTKHQTRKMPSVFWTNQQGASVVEFAIVLPLLLLLMVGVIEVTRLIMAHQAGEKAVSTINNHVSQIRNISQAENVTLDGSLVSTRIGALRNTLRTLLDLSYNANEGVAISGISLVDDVPTIVWKIQDGSIASQLPAQGAAVGGVALPTIEPSEMIIAVEVEFAHQNILQGLGGTFLDSVNFDGDRIQKMSFFRYRRSTNIPPVAVDTPSTPPSTAVGACCGQACKSGTPALDDGVTSALCNCMPNDEDARGDLFGCNAGNIQFGCRYFGEGESYLSPKQCFPGQKAADCLTPDQLVLYKKKCGGGGGGGGGGS